MRGKRHLKNVSTLELNSVNCTGCGMCTEVCPHQVFEIIDNKAQIIDKNLCMECGACAINCPVNAIQVKSGTGCSAGIINGLLRGQEPTCDCSGTKRNCC